jgi:hypothetical protein
MQLPWQVQFFPFILACGHEVRKIYTASAITIRIAVNRTGLARCTGGNPLINGKM